MLWMDRVSFPKHNMSYVRAVLEYANVVSCGGQVDLGNGEEEYSKDDTRHMEEWEFEDEIKVNPMRYLSNCNSVTYFLWRDGGSGRWKVLCFIYFYKSGLGKADKEHFQEVVTS